MFLDVGTALLRELGDSDLFARELAASPDGAFRTDDLFADPREAAFDLAAHAVHDHIVAVVKIDAEEVVLVAALSSRPSAETERQGRGPADKPVGDVQVVDVLLDDVVAGHHAEPVPVANEILCIAPAALAAWGIGGPAAAPPDPTAHNPADRALRDGMRILPVLGLMPPLGARDHGQTLTPGQFTRLDDLARPRRVHSSRLLHE